MPGAMTPALALSLSLVDNYSEGQLSTLYMNDDEHSEAGSDEEVEEADGAAQFDPDATLEITDKEFLSIDSVEGFGAKLKLTAISPANIFNLLI
ncbi:hypothetical protein SARC_14143 [Sphaeroforma arctica JP610]|uniref:Uncharacterized protein n=1 Tax=Sphaeroforma arctica JP610 TaxID=667725 RepID=A0A0L0F995_9EUKA|nr:hypothetical protein SARC_14143 [Sphaeroforma arctica JP610]KNC73297.1 hypothetical protein SARC_14143 [Sphaeroforma arctica JP610]|eukprot:XP_014147199.1 hypothetical protein SARC_14143 [Sphaeroforma arctica JP610]